MSNKDSAIVRLRISVFLIIGIAISLIILGIRVLTAEDKYITVEIIASGDNWWQTQPKVPYWLADAVVPGAIEYSIGGKKMAEILEVAKYDEDYNKTLWAKVKLMVTDDKATGGFRFQQQPMNIGSNLNIKPNFVSFSGTIISIGDDIYNQYKNMAVTTKLYGIRPWMADSIEIGAEKEDGNGNIVAKVIRKQVEPAEISVQTADGRMLIKRDPLRVDAEIDLEIGVIERNGTQYFNRIQPIKIGRRLWIAFDAFEINGAEIVSIPAQKDY